MITVSNSIFQYKKSLQQLAFSKKSPMPLKQVDEAYCECSDLELGCFLGLEMKRGLTAKGLRQAEVEYYLWGGCSLFPFVQVITDMQTGGAAFYKTGSSASGMRASMHLLMCFSI